MATARQTLTLLAALTGAVTVSQAPELTQQYRQRLAGALDELGRVVAEFDADAARNGMTRSEALDTYELANVQLFRDQGRSMRRTIERFEELREQSRRLSEAPPLLRPLAVAVRADPRLLEGAWRDFEPAVPVTPNGLAWTAVGFGLGAALMRLISWPFRRRRKSRSREVEQHAPEQPRAVFGRRGRDQAGEIRR